MSIPAFDDVLWCAFDDLAIPVCTQFAGGGGSNTFTKELCDIAMYDHHHWDNARLFFVQINLLYQLAALNNYCCDYQTA